MASNIQVKTFDKTIYDRTEDCCSVCKKEFPDNKLLVTGQGLVCFECKFKEVKK